MIMNPSAIKNVVLDGHSLNLESFVAVARYNSTVELAGSAPEALKGLTVIAAGEELRVQLRGMDVDLSPYALPTQSILTLLREVLTGEKSGKLTAQAEGDTVIASGSILLTTYEIVFDKETMVVREIRIPSLEGVIEVSDFTFAA